MDRIKTIGDNLRKIRKARGYTQNDLVLACDRLSPGSINPKSLSDWERGAVKIPVDKLCILASALECTADRIINCLPPEAVEDAMVVTETLARLTPHNREAIHWIFCHWNGNINALIELMLAHCGLSNEYRAETAGMALHQYQMAVKEGSIDPAVPKPDLGIIISAWEEIAGFSTWI